MTTLSPLSPKLRGNGNQYRRGYSTLAGSNNNTKEIAEPVATYLDTESLKRNVLRDNRNKSGVYL